MDDYQCVKLRHQLSVIKFICRHHTSSRSHVVFNVIGIDINSPAGDTT